MTVIQDYDPLFVLISSHSPSNKKYMYPFEPLHNPGYLSTSATDYLGSS